MTILVQPAPLWQQDDTLPGGGSWVYRYLIDFGITPLAQIPVTRLFEYAGSTHSYTLLRINNSGNSHELTATMGRPFRVFAKSDQIYAYTHPSDGLISLSGGAGSAIIELWTAPAAINGTAYRQR